MELNPDHPHAAMAAAYKLAPEVFKVRWRRHGDPDHDIYWAETISPEWNRYNDYAMAGHELISFGDQISGHGN